VLTVLLLSAGWISGVLQAEGEPLEPVAGARHPVAAVPVPGGLLVANERSHSVSRVDLASRSVLWEQPVGERPVAIAAVGPDTFVIVDHAQHQLIRVHLTQTGIRELGRIDVVAWPVSAALMPSGDLVVAGLWSRRLEILSPSKEDSAAGYVQKAVLPLPFNPRKLLRVAPDKLLVADGFGGRLAVVDVPKRSVDSIRSIQAHNIRGLALDPRRKQLYVAHQMLDERAATTRDNVSLGILLSNLVRRIPLTALLDPQTNLESESARYFLGRTLEGAADPNGMAFDSRGRLWVALGGTSELCEVSADGVEIRRVPVGVRPTDVISVGNTIAALETFGDGVALLDPLDSDKADSLPLGPTRALTRAEQGERLFYDGKLSLESWMSCNSCHPDGHTHGLLADTAGDGGFGNPKRTLSLLGTRDANPWAWNGQFRELSEQVHKSVTSSMQGPPISLEQTVDIVTFLHTLRPPPPVDEPGSSEDLGQIARGRALFQTLGCATCHIPPLTYTTDAVFDVGLPDERGQVKFNPPTLRGVSQRDRLFHDNRAASLEAVVGEFGHQLPRALEASERNDLLRFLRSL